MSKRDISGSTSVCSICGGRFFGVLSILTASTTHASAATEMRMNKSSSDTFGAAFVHRSLTWFLNPSLRLFRVFEFRLSGRGIAEYSRSFAK